jgi:hypothetical protein
MIDQVPEAQPPVQKLDKILDSLLSDQLLNEFDFSGLMDYDFTAVGSEKGKL